MKYLKTFESVSSQTFLEKVSNDILKFTAKQSLHSNEYPKDFYTRDFNINQYDDKIRDFLYYNLIGIVFKKQTTTQGLLSKGRYGERWIFLFYEEDFLIKILNKIENQNYDETDLYIDLWYEFFSTLLHELQHVYDDYISKGKYTQNKKTFKYIKSKKSLNVDYNDMKEEDFKKLDSLFGEYHKLPHEINARFTQAVQKTKFWKLDTEDKNNIFWYKRLFLDVMKDVIIDFEGWYKIDDIVKKRLKLRIYNYWKNDYGKKTFKNE